MTPRAPLKDPIQATLQYVQHGIERPVYFASEGGADATLKVQAAFDEHTVEIFDGRALEPQPTLDREGFCLTPHNTSVKNFYDFDAEKVHYEAEIKALVLAATGGSDALIFDHTLRSDSRERRGQFDGREPATVIHNDYTDASALKRLQDHVAPEMAAHWQSKRFAIINVWRSIKGPVLSSPLAMCDYSSTHQGAFVASERRAKDRIGELELMTFHPEHRWFYFSEQQFDEALLLKTFDSAKDGRARRVAHTAFSNPLTAPDAPPRESIESRLLVFFNEHSQASGSE